MADASTQPADPAGRIGSTAIRCIRGGHFQTTRYYEKFCLSTQVVLPTVRHACSGEGRKKSKVGQTLNSVNTKIVVQ
jgi:hypothetical protein